MDLITTPFGFTSTAKEVAGDRTGLATAGAEVTLAAREVQWPPTFAGDGRRRGLRLPPVRPVAGLRARLRPPTP
ncbi:hypothetical protein ACFQ1S_25600 [Kibdelosporangium lantanae]|uniref:Uncharacterized protein n=1 Tax=Kibdelosporangium lantanae TaxID=1497396 RepID=A0ABW3MDH7_9PSEU